MQRLRRVLFILSLFAAPAAQSTVVVATSGPAGIWIALLVMLGLEAPPPLPVSPHHLSAPAPSARDACTFVAGVRHCPLPPLRTEPRGNAN